MAEAHVSAEPSSELFVHGAGQAEHMVQTTNHAMDASTKLGSTWCGQPNMPTRNMVRNWPS
jgi:hypothetical protein